MFVKKTGDNKLVIGAPAKLNLDLRVLRKRPDGYHDIDSIFQAVSLFDRLTFTPLPDRGRVEIDLSTDCDVPTDGTNLISLAYRAMQQRFELPGGLRVELEKNIPVAAGLGGGSADGAATILATRILYGLDLTFAQMAELSADIGSDLPFFFSTGQAHVTGRGERVEPIDLPLDYWLRLVTPPVRISTAEAYAALRMPLTNPEGGRSFRGWKAPADIVKWLADTGNDFERVVSAAFPGLDDVKKDLNESGAVLTRMSGSGPTVFGIYYETPELEGDRAFGRSDWTISIVRPIRLPART